MPFRRATEALSRASVPFDVVLATDGGLAGDRVDADRPGGVPDGRAARLLVADRAPGRGAASAYLDGGGHVLASGDLGDNEPSADAGTGCASTRA